MGQGTGFGCIVCVGGSGSQGLRDMVELLGGLPPTLQATLLLALHRPVNRPSNLASVLGRTCPLPVKIATHAQRLEPGTCYVGEPSRHLALGPDGQAHLVHDPHHSHRNATIDLLFLSVAEQARQRAIGVILSGCLADGSKGLAAIVRNGGAAMARTPSAGCGYGDMPRNAMRHAGLLHSVRPAFALGDEIARHAGAT